MSFSTPHMAHTTASKQRATAAQAGLRLGERLRQLRVSAGLTQSDLAGDRFSKEYVSQIERGKTRPTRETIDWLSVRLGVDPGFLANGVSTDERGRLEGAVARAEELIEAGKIEEAREDYESLVASVRASGLPCDALRSKILSWRSRCWRHHRDYEAAREDVERALELAEAVQDPRTIGEAYFQASIVADREGHWVLARSYAEKAKSAYEQLTDKVNVGRLTNNLGMLHFLLGKPEQAIDQLKEAFKIALDTGNQADAAQAVSSLAQVHLRTGNPELAEEQVRHALQLLDG